MRNSLTIGQLAEAAGVNVETIRYYQRRGLLAVPLRPLGGQRRYAEDAMRQIAFIRRAQDLGFTLEEIASLLALGRDAEPGKARAYAEKKYEELESRLAELVRMRDKLRDLVRRSGDPGSTQPSPFIRYLYGEDGPEGKG